MQISIETTSALERRLTISLPSESFEQEITERLRKTAGRVRLPGFRPGRVPLKEVRRRFGPAVRAEVAGELMQSSFAEAIQQESLAPAGAPNLEVVKMDPGIDFEFTATFEVYPPVQLADLGDVEVKAPRAEITDQDLEDMVERLREQRKTWEPVDKPAADGLQVKVDFVGTRDGEAFPGGTGEDVSFVVGRGQMIDDFDAGVRGLSAGESSRFDASFPEDYQSEELRGQTVQFEVTVKEVAEERLPDMDDEFLRSFGVDDGDLERFRREVRENMQREMDAAARNQVKAQVMKALETRHELLLPAAMVGREIQALKQQMLGQFQQYGGGQAPAIDLPDDLFREDAERRVKLGLVVNEIVESGGLEPDAERVRERVETIAAGYAEPQQVVSYYYANPEQLQQIEMAVLEDQVVDRVLEQVQVVEVEASYSDIIGGKAVPELAADDEAGTENESADQPSAS